MYLFLAWDSPAKAVIRFCSVFVPLSSILEYLLYFYIIIDHIQGKYYSNVNIYLVNIIPKTLLLVKRGAKFYAEIKKKVSEGVPTIKQVYLQ